MVENEKQEKVEFEVIESVNVEFGNKFYECAIKSVVGKEEQFLSITKGTIRQDKKFFERSLGMSMERAVKVIDACKKLVDKHAA